MSVSKACNLHFWITLIIFTCYSYITFIFYVAQRDSVSVPDGTLEQNIILQSYTFYLTLVVVAALMMAREAGFRINCTTYALYSNLANIVWTYSIVFSGAVEADKLFISFLTYSMITSIISVVFVVIYESYVSFTYLMVYIEN
jgi:hypothetical protein